MPSSATPSPLDQLAGIEQMLRAYRDAVFQNGKVYGLDSVSHYHEQDDADEETPRKAILASLATLREVLAEFVEAKRQLDAALPWTSRLLDASRRYDRAADALYRLLTPDSPRQAGEEITDG